MPNTTHDEGKRERNRRPQVKFRAPEQLRDDYDDWWDSNGYDSRSEALKAAMRLQMGGIDESRAPLHPPLDPDLRKSYMKLVDLANHDGVIPHGYATSCLASYLGINQKEVDRQVLKRLRERSYLRRQANVYGDRSWTLVGWDDE